MSIASAAALRLSETVAPPNRSVATNALPPTVWDRIRSPRRPAAGCRFRLLPGLWLAALGTLLVLMAGPAAAGSLVPFTPGNSPCDGACTYEWALEETGAPTGEPERLVVPAGMISRWMSYARDGVPLVDSRPLQLMSDQPGEGYWFRRDGEWLLMVKLDVCQNWAVMAPPPEVIDPEDAGLGLPGPGQLATGPQPARLASASGGGSGGGGGTTPGGGMPGITPFAVPVPTSLPFSAPPPSEEPPPSEPPPAAPPPSPVPLPPGGWLLLAALAGLLAARNRSGTGGGRTSARPPAAPTPGA